MSMEFLYLNPLGRFLMKLIQCSGILKPAARIMNSRLSCRMVPRFIRKHQIDMTPFAGQKYRSFADFFARKKHIEIHAEEGDFLSPCDGLLTWYPIRKELLMPMKGSHYRICDLLPEPELAESFENGLCLVFRLRANDYHRFCAFDDMEVSGVNMLPGLLHSVQPVACETVPVYRLNRRWWSILKTKHFGTAAQIEIGAMLVGGVDFNQPYGSFDCGEELGTFTLAGSTIVVLLSRAAKEELQLEGPYTAACGGHEIPVYYGEKIGRRKK